MVYSKTLDLNTSTAKNKQTNEWVNSNIQHHPKASVIETAVLMPFLILLCHRAIEEAME
jgi:hypothetical protein